MKHLLWQYGDTNLVVVYASTRVDIQSGDLVFLVYEGAAAYAANVLEIAPTLAAANKYDALSAIFLGVAMGGSTGGTPEKIRVATTGVFEYRCAEADYDVGDLVVPTLDAAQRVEPVHGPPGAACRAIGRVVERSPAASWIKIAIESAIMQTGIRRP